MKYMILLTLLATTTQASFNFTKLEPAKAISVKCEAPDSEGVSECDAKYDNNTSRKWWLKLQADGVVYRYNEYPDTGVKPVPFGTH